MIVISRFIFNLRTLKVLEKGLKTKRRLGSTKNQTKNQTKNEPSNKKNNNAGPKSNKVCPSLLVRIFHRRPIDPSSVHPMITSMQTVEDDEAIGLLAELRAISDGSAASSRFAKLSVTEQERGDDQSFIGNTPENSNFNQYWYSSETIEVLTTAILEILTLFEGKRVAFLSTPSLYFALPEEKRKHCNVFEVRL